MSIDNSGIDNKVSGRKVRIAISDNHPIVKLSQALDWQAIAELVLPDLQASTKKGCW